MKRLDYTKVSVKLKKSEWRDEWFIYLEAYPVYETGNDKPKRVREYLRRSITTHSFLRTTLRCLYQEGTECLNILHVNLRELYVVTLGKH